VLIIKKNDIKYALNEAKKQEYGRIAIAS